MWNVSFTHQLSHKISNRVIEHIFNSLITGIAALHIMFDQQIKSIRCHDFLSEECSLNSSLQNETGKKLDHCLVVDGTCANLSLLPNYGAMSSIKSSTLKSLNFWELKSFVGWLDQQMEGAQLQNIFSNDLQLCLEFYLHQSKFLLIHLAQVSPLLALLSNPPRMLRATKPVALFLNSHAKNLRWQSAEVLEDQGRVVRISLGNSKKKVFLDVVLVPKFANLLVELIGEEQKQISWEKPKDLGVAQPPPPQLVELDWQDWSAQVAAELFSVDRKVGVGVDDFLKTFEKSIEKKSKALVALRASLHSDEVQKWRDLGEALKFKQGLSAEQEKMCDSKLSRIENMNRAFQKAKDLEKKKSGSLDRIAILEKEVTELQTKLQNPAALLNSSLNPKASARNSDQKLSKGLLEKSETQGRRLQLETGFEAIIGKSAKDNLSLLRKANSWDLWLHLKDYPGAHAIIHFPRGKIVPQKMIEQVAAWVVRESLKKSELSGAYDVVVVEARYVRPIKGDKLGRVSYHNPKTYRISLKTASSSS